MTWALQDDGKIKAPGGNMLDLGKGPTDPVIIVGSTVVMPGVLIFGTTALAIPAGSSAATNTTLSITGTAGTASGSVLMRDTYVNGGVGTTLYCFNDLVAALKNAGVIAK